jgi:hypothetical protein
MKTLTLRKEICTCDKTCSILFDGRKVVGISWVQATLPKCWKKGSDFLVIRADRAEADAELAYELASQAVLLNLETNQMKGESQCRVPNVPHKNHKDSLNLTSLTPQMAL